MKKHRLSKLRVIAGIQCHKQLWWRDQEPEAGALILRSEGLEEEEREERSRLRRRELEMRFRRR